MKNFVSERVLEDFYNSISSGSSKMVHIPKSDVFYVRDHLRAVFGKNFTLDYVEWALLKEGMINPETVSNQNLKNLGMNTLSKRKVVTNGQYPQITR